MRAQVLEEQVEPGLRVAARIGEAGAPVVVVAMDKDEPARRVRAACEGVPHEPRAVVRGGLHALEALRLRLDPAPRAVGLLGAVPFEHLALVGAHAGGHLTHARVSPAAQVGPQLLMPRIGLRAQDRGEEPRDERRGGKAAHH